MNFNKVNIGEEIKRVVNEKRLSNASFAKKLNIQRQNIDRTVFAKASLDTELLIRISEVLDYNFFALYFECNHINYITPLKHECEDFQIQYRDMFMLMLYLIGINAADLFTLKSENLTSGGRIQYHRAKTNRLYDIKVEPEALEIIEKYKGKKYLLNPLDKYKDYKDYLHHMNDALKTIGRVYKLGIGWTGESLFPDISSYWSRHTWATIAYQLDIPHDVIGQALGHAESDTTDIYIRYDNTKVDRANRKVIDYLKQ